MLTKIIAALVLAAPVAASALPIDASLTGKTEIAPRQQAFSKFTLNYSLGCGAVANTISDLRVASGSQTRALVTGRKDQVVTVFGFGPLMLSRVMSDAPVHQGSQGAQQGAQQGGQKGAACSGEIDVVSIDAVSVTDSED